MLLGERRATQRWRAITIAFILSAIAANCWSMPHSVDRKTAGSFDTMRAYIHAWLSDVADDTPIMTSLSLKETIMNDWTRQSSKYEIVSLRRPDDYRLAGHIPNAINIYWVEILMEENLARLHSGKTLILYCYYGHASMLVYTMLSLLGYPCCSLDFGMMDWNLEALVKDPWDKKADYEVETTARNGTEEYAFPDLASDSSDAKSMIKDAAKKYFEREGSPVIRSADVKAIVDRWLDESSQYQIVDVRSGRDYANGHIVNAINIPLKEIAERGNLSKLDPAKTIIVCSENGQMGQLACTVLNLLGYRGVNLLFGMMDWNITCVRGADQWDGVTSYTVELGD